MICLEVPLIKVQRIIIIHPKHVIRELQDVKFPLVVKDVPMTGTVRDGGYLVLAHAAIISVLRKIRRSRHVIASVLSLSNKMCAPVKLTGLPPETILVLGGD
jgi:hypothetical protein